MARALAVCALLTTAFIVPASALGNDPGCRPDPHPCGDAWPSELSGPFDLAEVRNVKVRSHDGVLLDGWIASPSVPPGTRTPTILVSSPYFDEPQIDQASLYRDPGHPAEVPGGIAGTGQFGSFWDDDPGSLAARVHGPGFPAIRLIKRGYTLAFFSVRGTGSSGGCFSLGGRAEQRDQKAIIDWIEKQPWSNRRVGMSGLSYMSWTTWSAAVQAPNALKAILTAGDLVDFYQFGYSPQGGKSLDSEYLTVYSANASALGGALSGRTDFLDHAACTEFTKHTGREGLSLGKDRNGAFWRERSVLPRLSRVRAAVLDTSGYDDLPGHRYQDSTIWGSLPEETPKVQFRGWWAHEFPAPNNSAATTLDLPSGTVDWETVVVAWFDYWLKGIGPAPETGVVYHQDQNLDWHEGPGWSPSPDQKEVLYLSDVGLTSGRRDASTSFRAAPPPLDQGFGGSAANATVNGAVGVTVAAKDEGMKFSLCPDADTSNLSRTYSTQPSTSPALIAGNPFVDLSLSSDEPGGMVTAELWDLGPDFECTGPVFYGARWLGSGSVDLNFVADPFRSTPFPVDRVTEVRIDLSDVTYTLEPGHRLVLVLSHGEAYERVGTSYFPTITIGGSSELVMPVAEGTLGGLAPTRTYPPRPFTSRGYSD